MVFDIPDRAAEKACDFAACQAALDESANVEFSPGEFGMLAHQLCHQVCFFVSDCLRPHLFPRSK